MSKQKISLTFIISVHKIQRNVYTKNKIQNNAFYNIFFQPKVTDLSFEFIMNLHLAKVCIRMNFNEHFNHKIIVFCMYAQCSNDMD